MFANGRLLFQLVAGINHVSPRMHADGEHVAGDIDIDDDIEIDVDVDVEWPA